MRSVGALRGSVRVCVGEVWEGRTMLERETRPGQGPPVVMRRQGRPALGPGGSFQFVPSQHQVEGADPALLQSPNLRLHQDN